MVKTTVNSQQWAAEGTARSGQCRVGSKQKMLVLLLFTLHYSLSTASAQQPQTQATQELFPVNAKYVQGVGPGYWPTAGSNLILNLAPGTAVCSNTVRTYAGGSLTLAPGTTNYVYLDPANNCVPASNTTGFTTASIPIATVVTTSGAISSINDVRTMFVSSGVTAPGTVTSVGMTGDGIIFSPAVSGSPITSSGALAPQLLTQTRNTVLAGPGSGPAATPAFRVLTSADLPATISSQTTGNAATATALAAAPSQCTGSAFANGIAANGNANCIGSQAGNSVYAAPNGSSGTPAFRALAGSDLPTIAISGGGTGQTTAPAAFNSLSPLSTEGDFLYYHSSANTRLGVGANGQCLTSNGTDPLWGSCGSAGVSSISGDGSLITNSGSTGAVTLTAGSFSPHYFWGNNTGSSAIAAKSLIGTSDTSVNWYAAGGGTAQAQTVTLSPAATVLTAGLTVRWKPAAANTGAGPTLAVNGLTATTVTKCGTTALVANDLTTSNVATAVYDGTEFQLLNPMAAGCVGGGNLSTSGSPTQYQIGVFGSGTTLAGISPAATSGVPMISQGASANPTFGTAAIAGGGTGQTTASTAFNALSPLTTEGDLLYYHSSANARLARGSNGQCLTSNGTDPVWGSCSTGSGTVTSVGLSMPSIFSVSGSPVTGSGTLTAALANQNAHLIMAGPSTGSAAAPTFRALVGADLPAPTASTLGGVESLTCTTGQFLSQISTGGVPACATPSGGGTSLGNGSTVIDATTMPGAAPTVSGSDFSVPVNEAIAACVATYTNCKVTAVGFGNSPTMAQNITVPQGVELVLPDVPFTRASGAGFIYANGHISGGPGTMINSANTTSDYSAVFRAAPNVSGGELDHLAIGPTTPAGMPLAITSVGNTFTKTWSITSVSNVAADGTATYTGSFFTDLATENFYTPVITGFTVNPNNNGTFYCGNWTATTMTCYNPYAVAESASATASLGAATYQGTITGGGSNAYVGMEFGVFGTSLSGGYNTGYFLCIGSTATSLTVLNHSAQAETFTATAVRSGGWGIKSLNSGTHYHEIEMNGTDLGIQYADAGCNCYNRLENLTLLTQHGALFFGSNANSNHGVGITAWASDITGGFNTATGYGVRFNNAGSNQIDGLSIENTRYSIDFRGNQNTVTNLYVEDDYAGGENLAAETTLPIFEPGSMYNKIDSVGDVLDLAHLYYNNNSNIYGSKFTRIPASQPQGSVIVSGITVYGSAAPALGSGSTAYNYWIVGVDFNGNKTLPAGPFTATNAASLSPGVATNAISFGTLVTTNPGARCFDILKGDTAHSLATCVLGFVAPFIDDGTISTSAYAAPTRNATGDITVAMTPPTDGTAGLCLDSAGKLSTGCANLGNGSTVIDASLQVGADFASKVNAAIAACPSTGCLVDARGLSGTQAMNGNVGPYGSSSQPITLILANGLNLYRAAGTQFLLGDDSAIIGPNWGTTIWGAAGDDTPTIVAAPGAYNSFTIKGFKIVGGGNGPCISFDSAIHTDVDNMQLMCGTGVRFAGYYNRFINNLFMGSSISNAGWSGIELDCSNCVNSNDFQNNEYSFGTGTGIFLRGGYANKIEGQENAETLGLGYYVAGAATQIHGGYFEAVGCSGSWAATTPYGLGAILKDSNGNCEIAVTKPLALTSVDNANGGSSVYHGTITGGATNALAGSYYVVQGFVTATNNGGPWLVTASTATTITLANPSGFSESPGTGPVAIAQPSASSLISKGITRLAPVGVSGGTAPTWNVNQGGQTPDGGIVWEMYNAASVAQNTLGWPAGNGILLENLGPLATIDGAISTEVMDLNAVLGGKATNHIETFGNLARGIPGQAQNSVSANPLKGFVFNPYDDDPDNALASLNTSGLWSTSIVGGGPYWGVQVDSTNRFCQAGGPSRYCGHIPLRTGGLRASNISQLFGGLQINQLPNPAAPTLNVVGSDTSTPATYRVVANCGGNMTLPGASATINGPAIPSTTNYVQITPPATYNLTDPITPLMPSSDPWSLCTWEVLKGATVGTSAAIGGTTYGAGIFLPLGTHPLNDDSPTTYTAVIPTRNSTGDAVFAGTLSTSNNTLDDGAGNLTAANKISAQQFCVSSNCVTSFSSNPMSSLGDLLYGGAGGAATRLAGNTSTAPMYLKSLGSGSAATAPTLAQIQFSDIAGTLGIGSGGTGQTTASAAFNALSPLTTEGDLIYYSSSVNTRLGVGANGQCLTSNGTDPVWGSCSGSGGGLNNPMTTLGDLIYGGVTGTPTRIGGNTSSTKNFLVSTGSSGAATVNGVNCTLGSSCTIASLNGVSFPASPSTNTVPVVTSSNTITYETVPAAALPSALAYTGQANTYSSGNKQTFGASTTSAASVNIPSGSVPTSPASGDEWNLSGIRQFYDGSHTNNFTTIQAAPTSGHMATFSGTAGLLVDGGAVPVGMSYPGAGVPLSTGSAWGTSFTAPTGNLVGTGQANTYTTGLQSFASATLSLPSSASYAPTTAGLFGYDSTNKRAVLGNGTNTSFPTWITAAPTSLDLPEFSGTLGLLIDSGIAVANVPTQSSNGAANQIATYSASNKALVPATTLPTAAEPAHTGDMTNSAGSLATTVTGLHFGSSNTVSLPTSAPTSGGVPYFSSASVLASSAALTQYAPLFGGGAGGAPTAGAAGTSGQILTSGGSSANGAYRDHVNPPTIIPAANCNNATAGTGWSLPTSGAPTVACRTGTNVQAGVLQFAASNSAQFQVDIPGNWDGSSTVYAKLYLTQGTNTTASQTIIMQLATGCSSTTDDPSFNTAQSFSTATTTATANTPFWPTLSSVTITGCSAGGNMNVKVSRSGSDSATTAPNVYWVALTFQSLNTAGAN